MAVGNPSRSYNLPYDPYIYTSYYKGNVTKNKQKTEEPYLELDSPKNIITHIHEDLEETAVKEDIEDLFIFEADEEPEEFQEPQDFQELEEQESGLQTDEDSVLTQTVTKTDGPADSIDVSIPHSEVPYSALDILRSLKALSKKRRNG